MSFTGTLKTLIESSEICVIDDQILSHIEHADPYEGGQLRLAVGAHPGSQMIYVAVNSEVTVSDSGDAVITALIPPALQRMDEVAISFYRKQPLTQDDLPKVAEEDTGHTFGREVSTALEEVPSVQEDGIVISSEVTEKTRFTTYDDLVAKLKDLDPSKLRDSLLATLKFAEVLQTAQVLNRNILEAQAEFHDDKFTIMNLFDASSTAWMNGSEVIEFSIPKDAPSNLKIHTADNKTYMVHKDDVVQLNGNKIIVDSGLRRVTSETIGLVGIRSEISFNFELRQKIKKNSETGTTVKLGTLFRLSNRQVIDDVEVVDYSPNVQLQRLCMVMADPDKQYYVDPEKEVTLVDGKVKTCIGYRADVDSIVAVDVEIRFYTENVLIL